MLGLVHVENSSMYQRNEDIWKRFAEEQIADYDRADGIAGYAWIARYTVHFLDAYLKHDIAAMAWIKKTPAENGAPNHFISASYRAAKGPPATLESFRFQVGQQGFDHAEDIAVTKRYLLDFEKYNEETVTAADFYLKMLSKYPDYVNPGSLWGAVVAAKKLTY